MNDRARNSRELQGLNGSGEHFGRPRCEAMLRRIQAPNIAPVSVRVWEIEIAWAAYRRDCA
jgi:6-pyruvoyltetrahydropterin/6-carboxytetrahydropterin synthase